MISFNIDQALNRNHSENGGHAGKLELKFNARVVLFINNDLKNGLVNCQLGSRRQQQKGYKNLCQT